MFPVAQNMWISDINHFDLVYIWCYTFFDIFLTNGNRNGVQCDKDCYM